MRPPISKNEIENQLIFDPVCGLKIGDLADIPRVTRQGKKLIFCSKTCLDRFNENPEKFQGEPFIKVRGLEKRFRLGRIKIEVLRDLNFNIWEGDFVGLIGASGSGKSTTLNMLGLLDRPTSGKIFLKGKDISSLSDEERASLRSKTFGFVFQQYNLIPWLDAYENVILPLIFADKKIDSEETRRKFREINLGEQMIHRPFEMSGGEQQRTAILRALANDPEIIIGDEPTGNLDSETGNKILEILIKLNKERGKTLIVVTHDADIAEKANQIITIKDGRAIRDHQKHREIYTE